MTDSPLCQRVQETRRPPGCPPRSAVLLRSMLEHPTTANDPHDTMEAVRAFHATHLVWAYGNKRDFIERLHALGIQYQGALSHASYAGDCSDADWPLPVAAIDLAGRYVTPHWMRTWKGPPWWGCVNNPRHRAGHLRAAVEAVEAGADFLQRDEPEGNYISVRWGACFCEFCVCGFRRYLADNLAAREREDLRLGPLDSFDYAAYLRSRGAPAGDALWETCADPLKKRFTQFQFDATLAFHRWWRAELNRRVGRYVPVACNNGTRRWTAIEQQFDFLNGELSYEDARPAHLYEAMRRAAAWGKFQVVTMPQKSDRDGMAEWERLTRRSAATAYAAGGIGRVPWDTFMPGDAPRFFGAPARYADLFGFVRACAPYLDGYEDAYAAATDITDPRWRDTPPPATVSSDGHGVALFVRAHPSSPGAPVVAHLVDWRDEPRPFDVTVAFATCTGGRPGRVQLLTPALYDPAAHKNAWETRDYRDLARVSELGSGPRLRVPPLTPWGLLVIHGTH
jgi:hypothetical protein